MTSRKTQRPPVDRADDASVNPGAASAPLTSKNAPPANSNVDTTGDPALTAKDIAKLAQTFHLLGDPSRLRILLQCMRNPVPVGEIADTLNLSQSLVSHHLRLLRDARLVKGERRAKQVIYEIADRHVAHMLSDMAAHITEDEL